MWNILCAAQCEGNISTARFLLVPITQSFHSVMVEVKESASRAGGPGFQSRQRRDFFGVESYQ